MAVAALVAIMAGVAFAVFPTSKGKARTAEPGQRLTEVAASVESYKQLNGGSVTGITADAIRQAYTSTSGVTVKVCPDWSKGAAAAGEYTAYAYVPSTSGSDTPMGGTKGWMLDSGVGPAPQQGTPVLCANPVVL